MSRTRVNIMMIQRSDGSATFYNHLSPNPLASISGHAVTSLRTAFARHISNTRFHTDDPTFHQTLLSSFMTSSSSFSFSTSPLSVVDPHGGDFFSQCALITPSPTF